MDVAPSIAGVPEPARRPVDVPVILRERGPIDYRVCYDEMRAFTASRSATTPDQLWIVEHPPVFTLGLAARPEHVPQVHDDGYRVRSDAAVDAANLRARLAEIGPIPVERTDRGGQITYHGPGQPVVYCLVDLARRGLAVRRMVWLLEQSVIDLLGTLAINGTRRAGAPGVYVGEAKIAALGLRVRRNGCYHGVSLNVDADLAPFAVIDPCGYPGLAVTRLRDLGCAESSAAVGRALAIRVRDLLENPDVH